MEPGTVNVLFLGICTHLNASIGQLKGMFESSAWGHRVVLADASSEDTIHNAWGLHVEVDGRRIEPHLAELAIWRRDIVTMSDLQTAGFTVYAAKTNEEQIVWRLNQILLSIANYVPGPIPSLPVDIPSLAEHSGGVEALGNPSLAMTLDAVPTRAAAFFDFFSGELRCAKTFQAASTILTTTTFGNPTLRVNPFVHQPRPFNPQNLGPLDIVLEPGANITVSNVPVNPNKDADIDFRVHYLTAARFPEHITPPSPPPEAQCPCLQIGLFPNYPITPTDTITPGCSNSGYP